MRKYILISALLGLLVGQAQAAVDACQQAQQVASQVIAAAPSSDEDKLQQLLEVYPPHGCIAPYYHLQLGVLQHQVPASRELATKNFKRAVQQANKQESVLRAHSLAWFSRAKWEAVSADWSEETQERERAEAYKEARTAKEIYNQKYSGKELLWFDDYLLDMGERLKNPSAIAIAAQLDLQTVSRDAIATASGKSVELRINFEKNSDRLSSAGTAAIGRLLTAINSLQNTENSELQLELMGHTSTEGSADYNMELSQRRALAVKRAIVAQRPELAPAIAVSGLGESHPIYPREKHELMRRANRRVEVKIVGS